MGKYFGTDGIRGEANKDLDVLLLTKLGLAIGVFLHNKTKKRKPKVVLGSDTRLSGYMIRSALSSGLTAMGVDIEFVGVIPTPGVCYLTRTKKADLGIMISASHNPIKDNGVKLFGSNGEKLNDDLEKEIEELIDSDITEYVPATNMGRVTFMEEDAILYRTFLKSTTKTSFKGYKVVIDSANGASYRIASKVFQSLGAETVVINNIPNGRNINVNCGSTHPETLQEVVKLYKADLGLAFDGDADRLIAVDEKGQLIDGDLIIAMLAIYLKKHNKLQDNTVVTTVLSNMGFEEYLNDNGIKLERSNVGDRHVLEKMRSLKINLGGEQSGHIIMLDHNTTGDGILAGIQLFSLLVESKQTMSELVSKIKLWPQQMESIHLDNKEDKKILDNKDVKEYIDAKIKELGNNGRVLIRPSGTEPLIRVMVEAKTNDLVAKYLKDLIKYIESKIV